MVAIGLGVDDLYPWLALFIGCVVGGVAAVRWQARMEADAVLPKDE